MNGECQCSLRTRLVGDGCQYCNPELAASLATDDPDEPIPYTLTPLGAAMLEGKK